MTIPIKVQMNDFTSQLGIELNLPEKSIQAVLKLLKEGNTVPFIARYRKEATSNLDELQIRSILERNTYLQELQERRQSIVSSIESQGKLSADLLNQIQKCTTKNELEDLYLPYKPKRRTKASIAKEKGLEPLALRILEQPLECDPEKEAEAFINLEAGVNEISEALNGACDIAAEIISENANIRSMIRTIFADEGIIVSKVVPEKENEQSKFNQYYDFKESIKKIPSHRYLAIRRGEKEGFLSFQINIDDDAAIHQINRIMALNPASRFFTLLEKSIKSAYKYSILPSVETDFRVTLKVNSDKAAVNVFADNLRNLLLASPLGEKAVIGIDPGLRTGCKCVAVDSTGKYLDTITIYLCQNDQSEAQRQFLNFINKYPPFAIGIGNGTGSRETEVFVRNLFIKNSLKDAVITLVSEAGASVYSASDIAREEFPNLDLTIRGAISIARRLQDPLAELVKVDPKAIGVGQYQHDVYQPLLHEKLSEVVESCVNHVGVELNTASAPLLSYVSGIGPSIANKIVKYREENGAFESRQQLLKVPGVGARTFEQAAGFLRLRSSRNPLDASGVHPERYDLVKSMASDLSVPLESLIANTELINRIDITKYYQKDVGELTLKDILDELKKPGRDPRKSYERTCFREDVSTIKDLKIGMKLDGIITNVTAFGAFVDIGVHQDGLIHISELTDRFINDPKEAAQVGAKITVEVLSIDIERKRIALTARIGKAAGKNPQTARPIEKSNRGKNPKPQFMHNPFNSL